MSSNHGLLVRFDPVKKRLVFVSIRDVDSALAELKTQAKEVLACEISELKQNSDDEAERSIGEIVLSYIDRKTTGGIGLRNYSADDQKIENAALQDLLATADSTNPEHQYLLAVAYISRAAERRSMQDLSLGEEWLRKAIKSGYQKAVEYEKSDWPVVKARIEEMIKRSLSPNG